MTSNAGQGGEPVTLDLATRLEMRHVPQTSMHDKHDPDHPAVLLVESIAMVMCSGCSGGDLRWRDRVDGMFFHADRYGPYEGIDCDASHMLNAAIDLGVPLYTGVELEFEDVSSAPPSPTSNSDEDGK